MSQSTENEWGTMVLPGVFMLRGNTASVEKTVLGAGGSKVQIEIVLHEIEVLEKYINKLKQSNNEIREYLKGRESKTEAINTSLTSGIDIFVSSGLEDDYDMLSEALLENEAVISRKKRELGELRRLVKDSRCACHYNTLERASMEPVAPENVKGTNEGENEGCCVSEISNALFRL